MSTEPFDYAAFLGDLEQKKAALEVLIASVRAAMAIGALGQPGDVTGIVPSFSAPSITGGEVPAGAFFGKSIPEAAKLYLEIVKKKQTSREIAEALLKGGTESTSSNFVGIVHAVLGRARKSPDSAFVRIGNQWGLTSWYPKGILSAAAAGQGKASKKKRNKAKGVVPRAKDEKTSATAAPVQMLPTGKANERALSFIRSKPDAEHSLADIAKHLGMGERGARLILGKLVKNGAIRMSAPGTYTIVPFRSAAAN